MLVMPVTYNDEHGNAENYFVLDASYAVTVNVVVHSGALFCCHVVLQLSLLLLL